ncbi:MAG: polyprenyl synthetase family protein [Proteobacteria bacterium]|nr:polyprenyl synthetase family protein [Pseudomonadota bacterium]
MTPELAAIKAAVEDALSHHLPAESAIAQPLIDAMRYAALSGGKRLRPMLVCAACESFGGDLADALAPACAVEYVHAYSLVHDDLPAMDNDELRHGLPSTHIAYGQAAAILTGDALLSLAFEVLADAAAVPLQIRLQCVQLLARASGWEGMVGGQHFDLASEGKQLGLTDLKRLHAAKTGALIKSAVQMGALFGGVSAESFVLMSEFGDRLGLAFQVIDDVLDVTATTETLGKPAGSDLIANKSTFPALMGVDEAVELAENLLTDCHQLLERANVNSGLLKELSELAVRRQF